MDVSIILVSYNTKNLTRNCIKSIYEKTENLKYDIRVVDNNSSDGSVQMIQEEFPQVKLVASSENLGFGKANNIAIKQSDAKYCFLLNTDTLLINNAVKMLFDFMEKPENQNFGACGGQLYNADMTLQHSVGEFDTIDMLYKKALGLNFDMLAVRYKNLFKSKVKNHSETQQDRSFIFSPDYQPDFIIGADLMLRKSALDKTGAFDEQFFMFGEEAELCYRIKKHCYKIGFVPQASIVHFGGASAYNNNKPLQVEKMVLDGTILFFKLCYGEKTAKKARLLYILYYLRYLPLRFFSPKAFKRLSIALKTKV